MPARLLLAALGGAALWLAFPGPGVWPAAPLGVGLLALATAGLSARRAFGVGWVAGVVCFVPLLSWSGVYVGALPWLALGGLQGLYIAAMAACCAGLQREPGSPGASGWGFGGARVRPAAVAVAWVAQELARSTTPFGGFPWARLAFSQADSPLARVAVLGGAPGVTFATALLGAVLAAAALAVWRRADRRAAFAAAGALGLVAGCAAIPLATDGPTARVLAVQGNVPRPGLDFNAERRAVLDNHVKATIDAALDVAAGRSTRPDLVIWPENASDIDPLRNADATAAIMAAVRAIAAPTLVGAVLEEPADHLTNASMSYLPDVGLAARYDKRHPVPFAEYIPWRDFFRLFSDKVDLLRREFVAGTGSPVLRTPLAGAGSLAVGVNICFEVAYDDLVADGVIGGGQLIAVQTNNATFGRTDESVQQLAISRIRAIEHGRAVAHVSNVGVSAFIAPDGTLVSPTALFTATTISADLPLRTDLTLATRLGQWPAAACAATFGGWVGAAALTRRRPRPRR